MGGFPFRFWIGFIIIKTKVLNFMHAFHVMQIDYVIDHLLPRASNYFFSHDCTRQNEQNHKSIYTHKTSHVA